MQNFIQYTPTEVVFGRKTEEQTGKLVKKWGGSRVLVVYGGGSAVRSGLLDRVEKSLEREEIVWERCGGVKPNPRLAFAEDGVSQALAMKADFILAIGGGSAIDTAKAIAHGTANPANKLWDIWTKKVPLAKSLPVGAVLTIPAAGSEMSDSAVLTNEAIGKKSGLSTPLNRVRFAVMNPELAATLPKYQIACGVTDIMMHTMERYFIPDSSCEFTDEIAEGLLRVVMKNGKIVLEQPDNYNAMAEVMWCGSLSHNGLTECGRAKDFSVHKLGHALSARYDVAHGASLAAVWASWARYQYRELPERFARFAEQVCGIAQVSTTEAEIIATGTTASKKTAEELALEGIAFIETYFREIGMPVSLEELGVQPSDEDLMELSLDATMQDTVKLSQLKPLTAKEVYEIFQMAK